MTLIHGLPRLEWERGQDWKILWQCWRCGHAMAESGWRNAWIMSFRPCFDTVVWVTRRASGLWKAGCWFVGGDDLTGTLHVLWLQLSPALPSSLAPINRLPRFTWKVALKTERDYEVQVVYPRDWPKRTWKESVIEAEMKNLQVKKSYKWRSPMRGMMDDSVR